MSSAPYHSTRPDPWTSPRPFRDASLRYQMHGPIQPMDADRAALPFWRRLLAR